MRGALCCVMNDETRDSKIFQSIKYFSWNHQIFFWHNELLTEPVFGLWAMAWLWGVLGPADHPVDEGPAEAAGEADYGLHPRRNKPPGGLNLPRRRPSRS